MNDTWGYVILLGFTAIVWASIGGLEPFITAALYFGAGALIVAGSILAICLFLMIPWAVIGQALGLIATVIVAALIVGGIGKHLYEEMA